MEALVERIVALLGSDAVCVGEPMSKHTSFRIGGPADVFCEPATIEEVRAVLVLCDKAGVPSRIVGRGSDLLISDEGLRGVVVHLGKRFSQIAIEDARDGEEYGNDMILRAQAGATNAAIGEAAASAGLAGFEFACGIPGTVGGAAIMNAGAYGGEFSQVCTAVTCLDAERNIVRVPREQADWSYRHSMFEEAGYVVLEAEIRLTPGDEEQIRALMADLAQRRRDKQPLDLPSAGSTFKRPPGMYAGKLIEDAGLRGFRIGDAQVSEKHCGFVVNRGAATADDVRALILEVQNRVRETAGVTLEPEVRMWGFA